MTVFIIGMIVLVSLHSFFLNLIEGLDSKTKNLKAKIEISKYILYDIYKIKSNFYEIVTKETDKKAIQTINKNINEDIKAIENSLNTIKNGGKITRVIKLNLQSGFDSKKTIVYQNDKTNKTAEATQLTTKIKKFKKIYNTIDTIIKNKKNKDLTGFILQDETTKEFYNNTSTFFTTLIEEANSLLYKSSLDLGKIEKELIKQKRQYTKLELFLIINLILLAIILAIVIAMQINKNANNLQIQEKFTRATLDSQENIVIVSDGEKMIDANNALIEFFEEYRSFEDFKKKHLCICDFFEEHEHLGDEFITDKMYKGTIWYEHIVNNPEILHKVAISKNRDLNYFTIKANIKLLDKKSNIIIITLNNITEEMKIQEQLKKLNGNLEDIANEKTKELKKLNENLEKKVEEEVEKNREKDKALIQQSRFAAIGEMIANIAHQWRQPLSAILTTVTSIQVQKELKIASEEDIDKAHEQVVKYVKFLNQTIEDFRSFFHQEKQKVDYDVIEVIHNTISITNAVYKSHAIDLHYEIENKEHKLYGFPSELSQVILNILTNARDILVERKIEHKLVKIEVKEDDYAVTIEITDNAGGIQEDILLKVFDPYFTTKHKSQGTGIGLYMSKHIIEKDKKASLSVSNKGFICKNEKYHGASFKIELPKF